MSVTCYYSGRFGNCVLSAAMLIAYAKKYNLPYFIPTTAEAYRGFRNGDTTTPFFIKSTGVEPVNPKIYTEPNCSKGTPRYHHIPKMDNVKFLGYYQSFRYFDWCRDYILKTFDFPYKMDKGITSISIRRGDCIGVEAFPIAPKEYYQNSVNYMLQKGFNRFRVFSDDMDWCKKNFNHDNFSSDAIFEFSEAQSEMENYLGLCNCENNITARSTFSLTAAWFNRNPTKTVLVPTTKHRWWNTQNADLVPFCFRQIDFKNPTDEWSH